MQRYVYLRAKDAFSAPTQIKRSSFLAVQVNLVGFLLIGTISLSADVSQLGRGAQAPEGSLSLFMLLTPVWCTVAHFAWAFVRKQTPSLCGSVKFGTRLTTALGIIWLLALITSGNSELTHVLSPLFLAFALPSAYCCFLTFGFLNGYFGVYFSALNSILLVLKLYAGERIDPLLWFNLLGLIEINSAPLQWAMLATTVALGLSERTFRILEGT